MCAGNMWPWVTQAVNKEAQAQLPPLLKVSKPTWMGDIDIHKCAPQGRPPPPPPPPPHTHTLSSPSTCTTTCQADMSDLFVPSHTEACVLTAPRHMNRTT